MNKMDLLSIPLEVFEVIVGHVCFVDLLFLFQTSKAVQTRFKATKFYAPLDFVDRRNVQEMHRLMSKFPKMWTHWSTQNVLMSYIDPHCHECGDFGFFLLWVNLPPIKLCAHCILQCPKYQHVDVGEGAKACGLERSEIEHLPQIEVARIVSSEEFKLTTTILRNTLISFSSKKGATPPTEDFGTVNYIGHGRNGNGVHLTLPRYQSDFVGCVKVSGLFFHQAGYVLGEMFCGHCQSPSIDIGRDNESCFEDICRDSRKLFRKLPASYDSLLSHIRKCHPALLPSFLVGWKALSPNIQSALVNPRPKYSPWRISMQDPTWTTWPEYAHWLLRESHSSLDYEEFRFNFTRSIAHQVEHSASAFGLPRVPNEAIAPSVTYKTGRAKRLTRGKVAALFIDIIFDKAMLEIEDWFMKEVEQKGLFSLYPMLEGENILQSMAGSLAARGQAEETITQSSQDTDDCK